jgi:hypothetical protein
MNEFVKDIKPFLGRIVIEIVRDAAEDHLKKQYESTGVSKEFLNQFQLAPNQKNRKTPISKGRILKMAPDAFGEAFKDRYGSDYEVPSVGDVVYFIPNESYRLDPNDEYHLVGDCDIVAYESQNNKGEENVRT